MSLLSIRDLSLSIEGREILKDVSFGIAPGEILGLVGESGSGKSMTSLAVMGLLPAGARMTGQVLLAGQDLPGLSERAMCALRGRRVGMIFQEPMTALNPLHSIGDQVAETLVIHGAMGRGPAREHAARLLARVGLDPARVPPERFPHQLSGGQRQRVCIAMAVALKPDLLIADEPTTALDVLTQAQILDLLRDLVAEQGMGLLLITHDLGVVAGIADRVGVMQAGRLVELAPTEVLFRRPAHLATRDLLAASLHQPDRPAVATDRPLLVLEGVHCHYPGPRRGFLQRAAPVHAVRGVDLVVHHGEAVGLVGPSGCGKSTLTRAILGLQKASAGVLALDGQPLHPDMGRALRARIQVVFQDPYASFDPRWNVGRLVAEPFHLLGGPPPDADARVADALEAVGIPASRAHEAIHHFSGGQRQRIAIARALVTRPDLVVLDEAVSALDVRVRAQVLDLLATLRRDRGLSYLFISHDLQVVRGLVDRVLVMDEGRIIETGPPEQVLGAPVHPRTKAMVAATPRIPADWLGGAAFSATAAPLLPG